MPYPWTFKCAWFLCTAYRNFSHLYADGANVDYKSRPTKLPENYFKFIFIIHHPNVMLRRFPVHNFPQPST